jgi:hypothetical protein
MTTDLIYSVEVAVIRFPGEGNLGGDRASLPQPPTIVRYCDICRRWGQNNTTHICWRNWTSRLSDVLMQLAREGQR